MSTAEEGLQLANAPAILGLTFRGFAGDSDYPKMLAVIEGSKHVDQIERTDSLEDIQRNYSHLTNSNPHTDMLFAEMNGEVIGYNRVWWERLNDGKTLQYSGVGFLLPEWRRKGIGTAMFRHAETRLREIAAVHNGPEDKVFSMWANGTATGWIALLESQGYKAVRYIFEMRRDINEPLPEAPMPSGLEVRPVLPEHYRAIWEADAEAIRDNWGYSTPTDEDYKAWLENKIIFQPDLWQIAWDIKTNEVAGQVLNFVNSAENGEYQRKRGYTEGISVRRPWRKQGLARSLIVQSIAMFKGMGMTETALGVDSENPSGALNLYLGLGYKEVKRNMIHHKAM